MTSQKSWLLLVLLLLLVIPSHFLSFWDFSSRGSGREEEGRRQVELLSSWAAQVSTNIKWFLFRRPWHWVQVTCEYSITPGNSDMWDRWKEKHPWMGGRLSSTLCFIVWGRGWEEGQWWAYLLQTHGHAAGQWVRPHIRARKGERFDFIYGRGRKPFRVEDVVRRGNCVEIPSFTLFSLTHNFSEKNVHLTDLFQSLIFKKAVWQIYSSF